MLTTTEQENNNYVFKANMQELRNEVGEHKSFENRQLISSSTFETD